LGIWISTVVSRDLTFCTVRWPSATIGGKGADRIVGSAGHDILVAGDVANRFTDEALRQISAAWAATKTVEEAVDDILDEEIIDANFDQRTGSSGADWFIIGQGDRITDFKIRNNDGDVVTILS